MTALGRTWSFFNYELTALSRREDPNVLCGQTGSSVCEFSAPVNNFFVSQPLWGLT
jgi:hypothetical protein